MRADWAFWEGGLKETGPKIEHFKQRVSRGAAAMDSKREMGFFFFFFLHFVVDTQSKCMTLKIGIIWDL